MRDILLSYNMAEKSFQIELKQLFGHIFKIRDAKYIPSYFK